MNAVQRIKARHNEAAQAEMDALLDALRPAMKRNVQRRREEEARKAEAALRKRVEEESRKALLNMALYRAGIPFQVM
nr:MAG TPA_asm: hypothetical protein [Caudoviricetes sp.]